MSPLVFDWLSLTVSYTVVSGIIALASVFLRRGAFGPSTARKLIRIGVCQLQPHHWWSCSRLSAWTTSSSRCSPP
jgi:hypothetical protein